MEEGRGPSPVPFDPRLAPPLLVIAGPTATGKTELAIELAEALRAAGRRAEIVSADSRQVYRGLDIGTAKASPAQRARVPHHGLDLVDPDTPFTVADFVASARGVLARLTTAGSIAILVGGTGLYLRAVARGLDIDALPFDPRLRATLEAALSRDGLAHLVARLEALAPSLAASVDRRNPRRVVRALEIALLVGDRPRPPYRGYPGPVLWLGLDVDRHRHRAWIHQRAQHQFATGLLDEAADLRRRFDPRLPAFSAIGYSEAWAVLDGRLTLEEAVQLDARRNLAFARRQRTWFRREPEIRWLDAAAGPTATALDLVRRWLDVGEPAPVGSVR